ncbi:hypothetical protein PCASD_15416 [Puccinia coronata f. sp. avenae]|uniref:Uncharacterized protein n=1 Tax=Puccinia coronata f. sp. avenae TaxID=200324 RepID=A0A2N5U248_9BASI|nr:hypothetical protein PCASD_16128 [Puccinia coronata f. sp. avenae]PLW31819.1 hypothetical protein PCASD_15416 [Puccinia coronata f. sp. avenae]
MAGRDDTELPLFACGMISLVVHPHSPMAPTFPPQLPQLGDPGPRGHRKSVAEELKDAQHFHCALVKTQCDYHRPGFYPDFS